MLHVHHGRAADGKIPDDIIVYIAGWKELMYYYELPELGVRGAVGIHVTWLESLLVAVERGVDGTIREYRIPTRFLSMMRPEELVTASK